LLPAPSAPASIAACSPGSVCSGWRRAGLSLAAALLSNAVSNVPAVMLFTPIIPQLPDPGTSWIVLAASSTYAGNLTILGSIANLIVVEGARRRGITVGFWDYARLGIPLTALSLALTILWFR
jgi:Na+/H+ antiporter NhaD/arsenite permease-like protein